MSIITYLAKELITEYRALVTALREDLNAVESSAALDHATLRVELAGVKAELQATQEAALKESAALKSELAKLKSAVSHDLDILHSTKRDAPGVRGVPARKL